MRKCLKVAFVSLFFLLCPTSVKADPVLLIGGSLFAQTGAFAHHEFDLQGPNFVVGGLATFAPTLTSIQCSPCSDGLTRVSVRLLTSGPDQIIGSLNGVNYATIGYASEGTAVFALQTGVLGTFQITAPIVSFAGFAAFHAPNGDTFTMDFIGQGQAVADFLVFEAAPGVILYDLKSVTFTFSNTEVHEPLSILLFGSGVAFLWGKRLISRIQTRANTRE
jgi:hypothetical protein